MTVHGIINISRQSIKDILIVGGSSSIIEIIDPGYIESLSINQHHITDSLMFYNDEPNITSLALSAVRIDGTLYFSNFSASPSGSLYISNSVIGDFHVPKMPPTAVSLDNVDFKQWNINSNVSAALNLLSASKKYDPSLYLKLAESLKSRGNYAGAREILFSKRSRDYDISDPLEKALNWISWGLVGYGVKPELGLMWFGCSLLAISRFGLVSDDCHRKGRRRSPVPGSRSQWTALFQSFH